MFSRVVDAWLPQAASVFSRSPTPCRGAQVAFIAGVMYTLVGIFNLGWITNFISHTVISGFMSGAAVIIGLGQVPPPPSCKAK